MENYMDETVKEPVQSFADIKAAFKKSISQGQVEPVVANEK